MTLNPLREPSRLTRFWEILNAELRDQGQPPLKDGDAHRIFAEAKRQALAAIAKEGD